MPTAPLIDCAKLDLGAIAVSREEIYRHCRQSGRFALLDGLLEREQEVDVTVGLKRVRADDWWVQDHIPGRPIFPGVLMIETAAQLCTYDFMHRRPEVEPAFLGFAGVDEVRFRGIVEPPALLIFAAKVERLRESMFIYKSQAFLEGELVFEAGIRGVVL